MYLEQLELRGFKRLRGSYEFSPGLTLVVGPNEAGKSSLHEAVVRVLFGFSRSERYGGHSLQANCAPWDGGEYGAVGQLQTEHGRSLRVAWEFREHRVTVFDRNTGEDLSSGMLGRGQDVRLGPELIGIGLEEFRQACCLDQAAIGAVARTEPLVVALRQAVETGATEGGVERALELLKKALGREGIGVRVDTLNLLAGGRLAGVENRRSSLTAQLEAAEEARIAIEELAQRLERANRERAEISHRTRQLEQQTLLTRAQALDSRLTSAREHGEKAEFEAEPGVILREGLETEIELRRKEIETLDSQAVAILAEERAAAEALSPLEEARRQVSTVIAGLEGYAESDASAESEVRELLGQREGVIEPSEEQPPLPARDPILVRYRGDRSRLIEQERPRAASRPARNAWIAAAAVTILASVAVAVAVHPGALAGLLLSALFAFLALRNAGEQHVAHGQALAEYGGKSFEELDRRLAEDEARVNRAEALAEERVERREQAAERTRSLEGRLAQSLDRANVPEADDLDARARGYLIACERAHRRTVEVGEFERLKNEIATARQPIEERARLMRRAEEVRGELLSLYLEAGVATSDAATAAAGFGARARQSADARERQQEANASGRARDAVLEGMTLDELASRVSAAAQELREHVAEHGTLVDAPGDETAIEGGLAAVRDEASSLDREITELTTLVAEREEGLPDVPAVREEEQALREQAARMRKSAGAIKLAREILEEAASEAHREFAPRLREALERNLGRLTGDRYTEAAIDEDLEITLVAPENGDFVAADRLSRGTQDQIYFLERLEMTRMLDRAIDDPPLLLDDPFVHFDEDRVAVALEVLVEEAATRQIILFSTNGKLEQALLAACGERATIRLAGPGSAPPAPGD
jgi:exonuclease SbcC